MTHGQGNVYKKLVEKKTCANLLRQILMQVRGSSSTNLRGIEPLSVQCNKLVSLQKRTCARSMADVLFSFATRFVQVSCTNLLRVYQRYKCSFALAALISMHACFSGMSLSESVTASRCRYPIFSLRRSEDCTRASWQRYTSVCGILDRQLQTIDNDRQLLRLLASASVGAVEECCCFIAALTGYLTGRCMYGQCLCATELVAQTAAISLPWLNQLFNLLFRLFAVSAA